MISSLSEVSIGNEDERNEPSLDQEKGISPNLVVSISNYAQGLFVYAHDLIGLPPVFMSNHGLLYSYARWTLLRIASPPENRWTIKHTSHDKSLTINEDDSIHALDSTTNAEWSISSISVGGYCTLLNNTRNRYLSVNAEGLLIAVRSSASPKPAWELIPLGPFGELPQFPLNEGLEDDTQRFEFLFSSIASICRRQLTLLQEVEDSGKKSEMYIFNDLVKVLSDQLDDIVYY